MKDPAILSVSEAAKICGIKRQTFTQWLSRDGAFRASVVIAVPSRYPLISRPRLERWLHGDRVA